MLTGGQVADCTAGAELLARLPPCQILHADKGYDSNAIRSQVEQATAEGLSVTLQIISGAGGHAAHMIVDAAREHGGDVIVAGTRGHAPVAGLLLGSVTQRLLHVSHCPVLVVPVAEPA